MVGKILCTPPEPDTRVIQSVMELSDERDTWTRRIAAESQRSYLAGYEDGRRAGYLHGVREMETSWPPIVRGLPGPTYAELELLRYPPAGRERFSDPQPGDRYSFRTGRLAS